MNHRTLNHLDLGREDPSLTEAQKLLSRLPEKMLPVVDRLHAIVAQMTPDVRRSFIPVLKEEVEAILNGQNEFSIRISRVMLQDGRVGKIADT